MIIRDIFEHFDKQNSLYISVNEVKRQIAERGVSDEILFHFVNIDEARLRGFLHRAGTPGGVYGTNPTFRSDIYIARSLDRPWRRVAAVKELLHIVDVEDFTVSSHEAVDDLLSSMALPPEIREWNRPYTNDRVRLISAIAILVPRRCREILRNLVQRDIIPESLVAPLAVIPERFVSLILREEFEVDLETVHEVTDGPNEDR